MKDECRICSCHGQRSLFCLGVGTTISMTIHVDGQATSDSAPADVHVNYEAELKMVFVRFDVIRAEGGDGVVSGTLSFDLSDVDALLMNLAEVHAAIRLAPPRPGN